MMRYTLTSPNGALDALARLYQDHSSCILSVREDRAFSNSDFLSLGSIDLFPQGNGSADYTRALRHGQFEWRTPKLADATTDITRLLTASAGPPPATAQQRVTDKIPRILDSIGAVPVRLGLTHPVFDPHALTTMPFRRPTTVVSDTSGVLQGGLSFVSRYLYPAARVKVPAIVQTEIVNLADRFLSIRRARKSAPLELLRTHLNSQAAQRVLIQLELHSDVELEGTLLFGDPLRGAFTQDKGGELQELNLSVPFRSYVDRLILEAARQHQSQVSVGHPVTILTSDQGLARMALAEGMQPLYFRAATAGAFFGRRFTGSNFHPFSGALVFTSVADVLWELATAFGSARLGATDAGSQVTVHAIGDDLTWAPYHSHDDLLWLELPTEGGADRQRSPGAPPVPAFVAAPNVSATVGSQQAGGGRHEVEPRSAGRYKYSVAGLIRLVDRLEMQQELALGDVMEILGVRTPNGLTDYRRFLQSGGAVVCEDKGWTATPSLSSLAIALRNADIAAVRAALGNFPSYAAFAQAVRQQPIGVPIDPGPLGRAAATLAAWGEITELGTHVHGTGFCGTPTTPTDGEFADIAIAAFEEVRADDGWGATGRWLEQLVMRNGVHPNVTRLRVQTAGASGLIRVVTEGSTTETQYDSHVMRVLEVRDGVPVVKTEYLYRGDLLIPGKSSSSVRIERTER